MEVRIGPKSYRSVLPVGFASGAIIDKMDAAEVGQMGQQIYSFNLRTSPVKLGEAYYERAFFLNGHCRFKRYSLVDLALYKLGRLFVRK